jgi:hypothetical protein
MKEDEKNSFGDTGVTQEIDFIDEAIDQLYIKNITYHVMLLNYQKFFSHLTLLHFP